jgi:hypothetical protein
VTQLYAGVGSANLTQAIGAWLVGIQCAWDCGPALGQDTVYAEETSTTWHPITS